MIALETAPAPRLRHRIPALFAIAAARAAARLNPRRLRAVLTRIGRDARPATAAEAARCRTHIVGSSMRCAGPRCLERSIATAFLCRLHGAWPDWCSGVALEPFRGHAWVEVDGVPIGEDPREMPFFTATMRVTCGRSR